MPVIPVHPKADLRRTREGDWVARDLDDPSIIWTWRIFRDEWERRERYTRDDFDALEKRYPADAFNTGWPGARPPAQRFKVARPCMLSTAVTTDVFVWLRARADREGKSMSLVIAEVLDEIVEQARRDASASTPST